MKSQKITLNVGFETKTKSQYFEEDNEIRKKNNLPINPKTPKRIFFGWTPKQK